MTSALYIANHIISDLPTLFIKILTHQKVFENIGLSKIEFFFSIGLIVFLELVHLFQCKASITTFLLQKPWFVRWAIYYVIIFAILFGGVFENRQFIYFQF